MRNAKRTAHQETERIKCIYEVWLCVAGIRRKRIFIGYQFGAPYQGTNYRFRWFFSPTIIIVKFHVQAEGIGGRICLNLLNGTIVFDILKNVFKNMVFLSSSSSIPRARGWRTTNVRELYGPHGHLWPYMVLRAGNQLNQINTRWNRRGKIKINPVIVGKTSIFSFR